MYLFAISCNGDASVVATGTPPFDYLWSNGSTATSVNGLCTGYYSVSVTDSIGCNSVSSFVIENDSVNFIAEVRHTSCIACDFQVKNGSSFQVPHRHLHQ